MSKTFVTYILYLTMITCCAELFTACGDKHTPDSETQQLIDRLDDAIDHRDTYTQRKEATIDSIRSLFLAVDNIDTRFDLAGHLFDEYRAYNADSAMAMCERRVALAAASGNPEYAIQARLNLAEQMMNTGMYEETLAIVTPLSSTNVPDYLRSYLFHIKRTAYERLADYAVVPETKDRYRRLTDLYRDSLLYVNDPQGLIWHIISADRLNNHDKPREAIALLEGYLAKSPVADSHDVAILSYTMADSYRRLGDEVGEERMLLKSAIHDMTAPSKEYKALNRLALLLHSHGDVSRAYRYLKVSMADARECNARQRIFEINDIFPAVEEMYVSTIDRQQRRLRAALTAVAVLAVFLLTALIAIRRQMKRVTVAREKERSMLAELRSLNAELKEYNERLIEANQEIAENSCLKEEYIARYMEQCLHFIDRHDSYHKSLHKMALSGRLDEIKARTKSTDVIDGELAAFYHNFDTTFLRLFPGFVDDFNSLLRPEEHITPKSPGSLTTELRIFALIRLGINDSLKIAKFLRYSPTTIYNYRTRVRNRAAGDRETLEARLMTLGRSSLIQ